MSEKFLRGFTNLIVLSVLLLAMNIAPSGAVAQEKPSQRFIVIAKSEGDHAALKADVQRLGAKVVIDQPTLQMMAVTGPESLRVAISGNPRTQSVVKDKIVQIIPPGSEADFGYNELPQMKRMTVGMQGNSGYFSDPANYLKGLLWNYDRIQASKAWEITRGSHAVRVGVADTGLDYTHSELASKVDQVVDLTQTEDPPLCKTNYGYSDSDYAGMFGGPADTDWNGHGTWIGGNIAAVLDKRGMNGIAPNVGLVALKIAQWCGSAYSSTILNAFVYVQIMVSTS